METIFIQNDELRLMDYPVGSHIRSNTPIIQEMIKSFKTIEEFKDKHINLICMGSSGTIIATMFSLALPDNTIVHVKKDGEHSHSSESNLRSGINVIVDDFISTGSTINRIYERLLAFNGHSFDIDCLCVSGYANMPKDMKFKPKYWICKTRP